MPIYVGDSSNIAKEVKSIYVGDENNKARRVLYAYVGDENNKAKLVYDDSERDFTDLNFVCTNINDATGGDVSVGKVYNSIPIMWNTSAELNTSVTFESSKLKLRKGDVVKVVFTISPPANCDTYTLDIWLNSGTTAFNKNIVNTKSGTFAWNITSSLTPVSFRINIYGSSANVKLTACNIYVNDIKIL